MSQEFDHIDPAVREAAERIRSAYSLLRVAPDREKAMEILFEELEHAVIVTEASEQKIVLRIGKPSLN